MLTKPMIILGCGLLWLVPLVSLAQSPESVPERVDIIVESDGITPSFYAGRAEPAIGNNLTLSALTFGIAAPTSELSYQWRVNNQRQNDTDAQISLSYSSIRDLKIEVAVLDASSTVRARKAVIFPLAEPTVVFYPNNPLRGLSRVAVPGVHTLSGNEVTISAIGYFFSPEVLTSGVTEWLFDGQKITTEEPWSIILRDPGDQRKHVVSFFAGNTATVLQRATADFQFFGNPAGF